MVEAGFAWNTPAQVDSLKLKLPGGAKSLQLRKYVALECVALVFEVSECRADKNSNNRPAPGWSLILAHMKYLRALSAKCVWISALWHQFTNGEHPEVLVDPRISARNMRFSARMILLPRLDSARFARLFVSGPT
jgi:hypothetical protein